jgi:TolA-binding protein
MQAAQQHAGQGQQAAPEPLRRRINHFLARTISRFRILLLAILIAAAAFLLGYLIYSEIQKGRLLASTTKAEEVQSIRDQWEAESDAAKKAALEKDLKDKLDAIISAYPRQYGGQRALFIRADLSYANKAWDAALADYQALASRFPASYLAPISLFNAGVCLEEKGDTDGALKAYVKITESYKDSTVTPRAIFSAGRLYEAKSDWENARKSYESLATTFSSSVWTKLAKDRVVQLKIAGKVK